MWITREATLAVESPCMTEFYREQNMDVNEKMTDIYFKLTRGLGLKPGHSPRTLVDSSGSVCVLDPRHIPILPDSETLSLCTMCQVD